MENLAHVNIASVKRERGGGRVIGGLTMQLVGHV